MQQFPYLLRDPLIPGSTLAPMIPLTLKGSQDETVLALVDSGASVNVLPFSLGKKLGFVFEQEERSIVLSGNLASAESKGIAVWGIAGNFQPVKFVFAWADTDDVPIILGQFKFFQEFDVCFFRSREIFELRTKS
jgi:hypothetical protein